MYITIAKVAFILKEKRLKRIKKVAFTKKDYDLLKAKLNQKKEEKASKSSKYKNKKTVVDSITFHSIAESKYYLKLKLMQQCGQISYFLMQVPFRLPGNKKYLADFLVFNLDGSHDIIDVKGMMTPMSKLKIDQVEDIYKVKIKLITKV